MCFPKAKNNSVNQNAEVLYKLEVLLRRVHFLEERLTSRLEKIEKMLDPIEFKVVDEQEYDGE